MPVLPFWAWALWAEGPQRVGEQLMGLSWSAVASVAYLAWLATLLAYTLWTRLLQRHPAAKVTPFSLLVPVVGLAAAALAFGEVPVAWQWVGTVAVLMGLVVNQAGAWWVGRRRV